jgi:hypothetical protein
MTTVDFSGYKSPTIARRIQRRMALQKIEKLRTMAPCCIANAAK